MRWGDYDTMIYDPSAIGPGGEGVFWQIEEISKGRADESTTWNALSDLDSLPYFVSNSGNESECIVNPGDQCGVTVNAPAGLVSGDVVIAFLDMSGSFPTPPTPPDGWTSLPIANMGNATSMVSGRFSANPDLVTLYAYVHVYGSSSEGGTCHFHHLFENTCNGNHPELGGFLMGYRSASNNVATYALYGYPAAAATATVTVGPATVGGVQVTSPSDGTLLNVFNGLGFDIESSEFGTTFSNLTGTPTATNETPVPSGQTGDYFLADVGIAAAGRPLAQYSVTSSVQPFTK
jgi:hypothetical protein